MIQSLFLGVGLSRGLRLPLFVVCGLILWFAFLALIGAFKK